MTANGIDQHYASGMDLPTHDLNYEAFVKVLKRSMIAVGVITAIVIYIIAS